MTDAFELLDLAAKRLGGMAVAANDEFFGPKERLLEPAAAVSAPGRYTDRGKWVDGWETRRRREPGHDWCVVRLGVPGVVRGVMVDTTHFKGNHPQACSLDGLAGDWVELLQRTGLAPDAEQRLPIDASVRVTHVRLNIHPDGGVARLRVHGEPLPDLRALAGPAAGAFDLAAAANGGEAVACSDMFFSSRHNLVMPGDAADMGDGWETRRRRGPGHDWVVVRLAAEAVIERVEVGTTHFKGNHPESCTVEACLAPGGDRHQAPQNGWFTVVARSRLGPHATHMFPVTGQPAATHVRLAIHPDGGVSRLRVFGRVAEEGWRRWGVGWLNALAAPQAEAELLACCGSTAWAAGMAQRRPFADADAMAADADRVWSALGRDDLLEAFAAHPRIGARAAAGWSAGEQAGVDAADPATMAELAEGNRAYEQRFGHTFLICATGQSAAAMLAALRRRLGNDPAAELREAAEEQRKITRLRLEKLLRP